VSAAAWAERYIERFGFSLVPLKGKLPYRKCWQTDPKLISTVVRARIEWRFDPNGGIGVCLEPSKLVSLDADQPEHTRTVLRAEGLDLDALIAATPTILGRAPRLEFRAPAVALKRKVIKWPHPQDPTGKRQMTILELRAGRVQDVLPPTIHPGTGQPYRWLNSPRNGFPSLPDGLLRLWLDFDAFKHRARNLCPWAPPEPEPPPPRQLSQMSQRQRTGPSVIQAFNDAHDIASILEAHGYTRDGKRFKSPHAKAESGAGVVLLDSGHVFCHHEDDQLGDGKAHDAFDLFVHFDHGGDQRAAVRAAAKLLGMSAK
jgi:putative DNA primase/helicase